MHVGVDGGKALADTIADINCYVSVVKIRGCSTLGSLAPEDLSPGEVVKAC